MTILDELSLGELPGRSQVIEVNFVFIVGCGGIVIYPVSAGSYPPAHGKWESR